MGKKMMAALLASAFVVGSVGAQAQAVPSVAATAPDVTSLQVSATSQVRAVPDIADIGAGVVIEAPDAQSALAQNTAQMTRVVAALKKAGVAARDIQTSNLSLQPQYRYEEAKAPILTGFRASNQVRVILRDLPNAGKIIDILVREGANQLDGPNFAVADPAPLLDKARVEAVRLARARAELYAEAAGLKVKAIRSISEGHVARPVMEARAMVMKADMAPAPVEIGEVELGATVSVAFELVPR